MSRAFASQRPPSGPPVGLSCGWAPPPARTGASPRPLLVVGLERWERVDPRDRHTIAVALSFRTDGRAPSLLPADARCRYHEDLTWPAGSAPPSYGLFRLATPRSGPVEFTEALAYEPADGSLAWDTGDRLRVETTGSEVPPFTLEDVVPAKVTLTSHDLPNLRANALRIPRATPLAIRWTPADGEVYLLFLQFDDARSPRRSLWCFYPARDGAASVSTAALSRLIPSSGVRATNLYFGGASRRRTTAGAIDVEMITWHAEAARVLVD